MVCIIIIYKLNSITFVLFIKENLSKLTKEDVDTPEQLEKLNRVILRSLITNLMKVGNSK